MLADERVAPVLGAERLAALFDPLSYTGEAPAFVDRVLAAHRQRTDIQLVHQFGGEIGRAHV